MESTINKKNIIIIFLLLFALCPSAIAQTIATRQAGDWNDCATWPAGRDTTPTASEDVRLDHAVTLRQIENVGSISLGSSGSLDLNGFGIGLGGANTTTTCCTDYNRVRHGQKNVNVETTTNDFYSTVNFDNMRDSDSNSFAQFKYDRDDRELRIKASILTGKNYQQSSYEVRVRLRVRRLNGSGVCGVEFRRQDGSLTDRRIKTTSSGRLLYWIQDGNVLLNNTNNSMELELVTSITFGSADCSLDIYDVLVSASVSADCR